MGLTSCSRTCLRASRIAARSSRTPFPTTIPWIPLVGDRIDFHSELMKQMEESKFDADHYLSDYFYGKEDYLYTEFIDIPFPVLFLPSPTFPPRLGQSGPHHPQAPQRSLLASPRSLLLLRPSPIHQVCSTCIAVKYILINIPNNSNILINIPNNSNIPIPIPNNIIIPIPIPHSSPGIQRQTIASSRRGDRRGAGNSSRAAGGRLGNPLPSPHRPSGDEPSQALPTYLTQRNPRTIPRSSLHPLPPPKRPFRRCRANRFRLPPRSVASCSRS